MSFDVTFLPTHLSAPRLRVDTASSRTEVLAPLAMSDAQLEALRAAVARHGSKLDEHGTAVIDVPGARIALDGVGPGGGSATLWGNLDACWQILFDLASAGELAMQLNEDEAVATTREARERAGALDAIGPCAFIRSPADLKTRIAEELEKRRTSHA